VITQDEIRREAEAKIGISGGVPSHLWGHLVEEGMVAAVMRGEKDIPWLTDRFWAIARLTGLERRLHQPPPMLTAQQRQHANDHQTVLAILVGREAANDEAVVKFRQRALMGQVLPLARVKGWLEDQAAKDGKPTVWLQNVAVPPDHEIRRVPHRWMFFTEPGLTISQEHPAEVSSRMLVCALPGEPPVTVMTSAGGVLEELRELSQRLARRFGWNPLQAVLFILTGAIPSVPLVRVTSAPSASRPGFTRVILDVDPTASPSLVAEQYRQHRLDVFPRRVRALSRRHLELAALVAQRPGEASWPELFEEWNRRHPKWRYQRKNNFKRDCLRARMRVLTLGMAGSRRSYSEDEGKLVSRVRLARKASGRVSPAASSRKERTQVGRRSLKRDS
jgi:hypothetical protein